MIGSFKTIIIFAIFLSSFGHGMCDESNLMSSAYVPVGNSIYSFLENCASRGLIPVSATILQPLPRLEIGQYILDIYQNRQNLNDRVLLDDLEYFRREFAFDIERILESKTNADLNMDVISGEISPHWHLGSLQSECFSFIFDPIITARWDIAKEKTVFRRATGIQFRGHVQNKIGFSFRFVDHVERGNSPYRLRTDLLEDRWGYVGPLLGGSETYYDLTEAYLTLQTGLLGIAFGKDRLAWGPGEEHLLIGGSAPSINHLRFRFDLGKNCRLMYAVGKLTPWKTPGDSLYTSEEGWTRLLPAEKWLAAHRFEYFFQDFLTIGISEAIVWGNRGLDIAYLNPLNFLFSAEHDGGDIDNVLLSADIELRLRNWGLAYGSLLIDDMKTSTLGEGSPGNKFGYTTGFRLYNLGISGLETSLDYTRIDPFVYSHFFPVNRYTTWTSSLGSSLKPNSDRIRWRLKYRPKRNLAINLKVDSNRHGTVGGEILETIPRNPNEWSGTAYLLDGDRTSWVEVETTVAYEAYPGLVFESGIIDGNASTTLPDRYFLGFSYRF